MGKYDKVIEFMLNHKSINYNDFYYPKSNVEAYRNNRIDDSFFKKSHIKLLESINNAINKGAKIKVIDQDGEFEHVFINDNGENSNKARLYLSPERKNLLPLIVEIINRSLSKGHRTYIKYAQEPYRIDQLLFYLQDTKDIIEKLKLLDEIKRDNPQLFQGMSQAPNWIYETSVPNVYLTPDTILKDRLGRRTSYGQMFVYALKDTKDVLEYFYGVNERNSLKEFKKDSLFNYWFENVFEEMLTRYGIFMNKDKNGNLVNNIVPGNNYGAPISSFSYDKKSGVLKEDRDLGESSIKEWSFGQNPKEKTAFMEYICRTKEKSDREH